MVIVNPRLSANANVVPEFAKSVRRGKSNLTAIDNHLAQISMSAMHSRYEHPSAWTGEDMQRRTDWVLQLDHQDNDLLHRAVLQARRRGLGIPHLKAADLDLGRLAGKLAWLRVEVAMRRGFVLVRGFDIDRYSLEDAALAYWAVGTHLGSGTAQNAQGDVLGHVTNIGVDFRTDPRARGYQSKLRLPFHNDGQDVVGLLCLHPAQSGGESLIVSSTTVYNEVLRLRPDLMPVAHQNFCLDRRGEAPVGKAPWYAGPLFNRVGEVLFCRYNRTYIESAQRFDDVPRLSGQQVELLDLIDRLCADPQLCLSMELQRGDMQFISNYTVLHSRTQYEDGPDPAKRRYLLRLWLDTGLFDDLPASFADRYEDIRQWQLKPQAPIFDLAHVHTELAH
jgi:hypothetical protein